MVHSPSSNSEGIIRIFDPRAAAAGDEAYREVSQIVLARSEQLLRYSRRPRDGEESSKLDGIDADNFFSSLRKRLKPKETQRTNWNSNQKNYVKHYGISIGIDSHIIEAYFVFSVVLTAYPHLDVQRIQRSLDKVIEIILKGGDTFLQAKDTYWKSCSYKGFYDNKEKFSAFMLFFFFERYKFSPLGFTKENLKKRIEEQKLEN